jgi:hypothetical protein
MDYSLEVPVTEEPYVENYAAIPPIYGQISINTANETRNLPAYRNWCDRLARVIRWPPASENEKPRQRVPAGFQVFRWSV